MESVNVRADKHRHGAESGADLENVGRIEITTKGIDEKHHKFVIFVEAESDKHIANALID